MLPRKRGRPPIWTPAEDEFLRAAAGKMTDPEIAKTIRRLTGRKVTPRAVTLRRQRLEIKQWGDEKPKVPPDQEFLD